jgi:hypothetical protein
MGNWDGGIRAIIVQKTEEDMLPSSQNFAIEGPRPI